MITKGKEERKKPNLVTTSWENPDKTLYGLFSSKEVATELTIYNTGEYWNLACNIGNIIQKNIGKLYIENAGNAPFEDFLSEKYGIGFSAVTESGNIEKFIAERTFFAYDYIDEEKLKWVDSFLYYCNMQATRSIVLKKDKIEKIKKNLPDIYPEFYSTILFASEEERIPRMPAFSIKLTALKDEGLEKLENTQKKLLDVLELYEGKKLPERPYYIIRDLYRYESDKNGPDEDSIRYRKNFFNLAGRE